MGQGQNTLYLEWGGDFLVNQNGGLVMATGWDQIRQRVERRLLTNPSFTLDDGTVVPAEYIFDPDYGIGCRALVGQTFNQAYLSALTQKIIAATLVDQDIDETQLPQITTAQLSPSSILVTILVFTLSGEPGELYIKVN